MLKIPFIKRNQIYYFNPEHMICSFEEHCCDYIYLDAIDSRFIKERFKSENYIIDEEEEVLILFDKGFTKYQQNKFKYR
ncbi:MAG: hypothetical protein ACRDA3_13175 [Peptostreptococcaceae bacterium]